MILCFPDVALGGNRMTKRKRVTEVIDEGSGTDSENALLSYSSEVRVHRKGEELYG